MRRFLFLLICLFSIDLSFGQSLSGLYGECDDGFGKYACQQVLLDTDGHFEFYDYLHLNGKKINKGLWTQNGDTVVLNSYDKPAITFEKNNGSDHKITICVVDSSGWTLGGIFVNLDTVAYGFDQSKCTVIPNRYIEKLSFRAFPNTFYELNFDSGEIENISKIIIYIKTDFNSTTIFRNEKWLVSNGKLLHTRLKTGEFDRQRGFDKTKLRNKKF
jgi:hypothetical protein